MCQCEYIKCVYVYVCVRERRGLGEGGGGVGGELEIHIDKLLQWCQLGGQMSSRASQPGQGAASICIYKQTFTLHLDSQLNNKFITFSSLLTIEQARFS